MCSVWLYFYSWELLWEHNWLFHTCEIYLNDLWGSYSLANNWKYCCHVAGETRKSFLHSWRGAVCLTEHISQRELDRELGLSRLGPSHSIPGLCPSVEKFLLGAKVLYLCAKHTRKLPCTEARPSSNSSLLHTPLPRLISFHLLSPEILMQKEKLSLSGWTNPSLRDCL